MIDEALEQYIRDCMDQTCIADMVDEGAVEDCKNLTKALKSLNEKAEVHKDGAKAAINQHSKALQ